MTDERVEWEFDHKRFMADARASVGNVTPDKPTLRDIEAVTGISASTYSRIDMGNTPDMEGYMKACARLGLNPGDYFKRVVWRRVE